MPIGLDFGAVMQFGAAIGADLQLLADVLPDIEGQVVGEYHDEGGGDE